MKTKRVTLMAAAASAFAMAGPVAGQQPGGRHSPGPGREPVPPGQAANPSFAPPMADRRFQSVADPAGERKKTIEQLQRELADLEAASAKRREQLLARIAQLREKEQRERRNAGERRQPGRPRAGADAPRPAAPLARWHVGIMIDDSRRENGVKVGRILDNSPAEKAGLKAGDLILACNGIRLRDSGALVGIIQAARDQEITFTVARGRGDDGKKRKLDLKVKAEKREGADLPGDIPDRDGVPKFQERDMRRLPGNALAPGRNEMQEMRKQVAEIRKILEKLMKEVEKLKTN